MIIESREILRHQDILARASIRRVNLERQLSAISEIPKYDLPASMVQDLAFETHVIDTILSFMPSRSLALVDKDPIIYSKTLLSLRTLQEILLNIDDQEGLMK